MKVDSPIQRGRPIVSLAWLEALLGSSRSTLFSIAERAGRYYDPFDRRRKAGAGKWRHIDNPQEPLKGIQKLIQRRLLNDVLLPGQMFGGIKGRCIAQNAANHVAKPWVAHLDLRDCFPSISNDVVKEMFRRELRCSPEIASLLTRLTTFQHRLPQGAPTSSMIANLTLLPLYRDVEEICLSRQLEFSFFVDDINFSGAGDPAESMSLVIEAIHRHGHTVSREKVECIPNSVHQNVTGLCVNRTKSVGRWRIREIWQRIHEVADSPIILQADLDRIRGELAFVRSVSPLQSRALERKANKLLPAKGERSQKVRTGEFRHCSSYARHIREKYAGKVV